MSLRDVKHAWALLNVPIAVIGLLAAVAQMVDFAQSGKFSPIYLAVLVLAILFTGGYLLLQRLRRHRAAERGERETARRADRPMMAIAVTSLIVSVLALATTLVVALTILPGPPPSGPPLGQSPPTSGDAPVPPVEVVQEYDLELRAGLAHDLDLPPEQAAIGITGLTPGAPEYDRLDLYRTIGGPDPDQISGVESPSAGGFNPLRIVSTSATPTTCRQLGGQRGGNAHLAELAVGSRICLLTSAGRPTLLTVRSMPAWREEPLRLRVTVLIA